MKHLNRGFTLVDILISLSITAAIMFIGVPSFDGLIRKTKNTIDTGIIIDAIHLGRYTAIKERRTITVCLSSDSIHCDKVGAKHIAVFRDDNENKMIDDKELIYISPFRDGTLLTLSVSGGRNYIRFKQDGAAMEFGRIRYCPSDHNSKDGTELIINILGRIILASDEDQDGIIEDKFGNNIAC